MKTLVQHITEAQKTDKLIAQYEAIKEFGFTFIRVTDSKRHAMSRTLKMSSISFDELESEITSGEYNIQDGNLAFDVSALDEAKIDDLEECINQFLYDANERHITVRRYGEYLLVVYKEIFSKLPKIK
jgi:hypothetical protein